MKAIVLSSALALAALTSAALAAPVQPTDGRSGPVELTDAQLDKVAAGAPANQSLRFLGPPGQTKQGNYFCNNCLLGSFF